MARDAAKIVGNGLNGTFVHGQLLFYFCVRILVNVPQITM